MLHFSLWTDMVVLFTVVIVVFFLVVLNSNLSRRPRPMRRKIPERIDARLAEILEQVREPPAETLVETAVQQESEGEPRAEEPSGGQASGAAEESSPGLEDLLAKEDAPREEVPVVHPRVAGAGSARLFRGEEEGPVKDELDAESSELWHRLKDRYGMYVREKQDS